MNVKKIITTAFAAIALTASLGASAAMIKGTTSSVHVDLSDLDLTSAKGEQTMQVRLQRAARQVCGPVDLKTAGSLKNVRENRTCFNEAYSNALEDVAERYLTAAK